LSQEKIDLIDYAFQNLYPPPKSFADLGGVWGVDAGYTFYTMDKYKIKSAFLVDGYITEPVRARPDVKIINKNFGDKSVLDEIGHVDVIFLFDVLLHQVDPDWDGILKLYANATSHILIANPQYLGARTVRLIDLGKEEYMKNVPHRPDDPVYVDFMNRMDEMDQRRGRKVRDIESVWQWGITDADLIQTMKNLNFELKCYRNSGRFVGLENFELHTFAFTDRRNVWKEFSASTKSKLNRFKNSFAH
jgi:hypothetical protein